MIPILFDAILAVLLALVLAAVIGLGVYFAAFAVREAVYNWRLDGIANRNQLDDAIAEQRARLDRERAAESARIDAEVRRVLEERR
jgi:hypothetical protein